MGYMRHHAILVTSDEVLIQKVHAKAREIFCDPFRWSIHCNTERMVSPVMCGVVNDEFSFFIAPDGSKEGWPDSDTGNALRAEFRDYLESLRYADGSSSIKWAEVQYGDDEGETCITADGDAARRQAT